MDAALPPMLVYDATGAECEIVWRPQFLILLLWSWDQVGLHVKKLILITVLRRPNWIRHCGMGTRFDLSMTGGFRDTGA